MTMHGKLGDAPCAAQPEASVFRSRCAGHIAQRDAELASLRHKRGLEIKWLASPRMGVFTNLWGAGHTLPVVCQLHALCRRLRRFCYVSLYDTLFDEYFGFANGMAWQLKRKEVQAYSGSKQSIELHCNATRHDPKRYEPFIEGELHRAVAASDAALVRVTVRGWLPMVDSFQYREPLDAASTCACRYVTEPRLTRRPALARWLGDISSGTAAAAPAHMTALHLRTGFADVENVLAMGVRSDAAASASFVRAACGADPFADGAPRFVMSDSPGVLRHLTGRYAHVHANAPPANTSTRSWFTSSAVKLAVYDDLVVAGLASALRVAPQMRLPRDRWSQKKRLAALQNFSFDAPPLHFSGFARAVLARSVCIRAVRARVPECARFAQTFPRNLLEGLTALLAALPRERDLQPGSLDAARLSLRSGPRWAKRLSGLQAQIAPGHPCASRNASADPKACVVGMVAALK